MKPHRGRAVAFWTGALSLVVLVGVGAVFREPVLEVVNRRAHLAALREVLAYSRQIETEEDEGNRRALRRKVHDIMTKVAKDLCDCNLRERQKTPDFPKPQFYDIDDHVSECYFATFLLEWFMKEMATP